MINVYRMGNAVIVSCLIANAAIGVDFVTRDFDGWSLSDVQTVSNGANVTNHIRPTGGNSDSFIEIDHILEPSPSGVYAFHRNPLATYDPSRQGTIESVAFSVEYLTFESSGEGQGFGAAVLQDGIWYSSRGPTTGQVDEWTRAGRGTLHEDDFGIVIPVDVDGRTFANIDFNIHPNFSISGSPIQFGLSTRNSHSRGDNRSRQRVGYDNWELFVRSRTLLCDLNRDGQCDVDDVNLIAAANLSGTFDEGLDISQDGQINGDDSEIWISDSNYLDSYVGDANLDGVFDSTDLVLVFSSGQYEDDVVQNSTWAEGDWNSDGEFDSGDMVAAFFQGGYNRGPRPATKQVPEPAPSTLIALGILASTSMFNRRSRDRE